MFFRDASQEGGHVNERLKRLMEEFNAAVNDWLLESKEIAQVMAKIEANGYDVFLAINVIKKQEEEPAREPTLTLSVVRPGFTSRDIKFLKSMHISASN